VRSTYAAKSAEVLREIEHLIDALLTEEEVVGLPSLTDIATFVEKRAGSLRPELEPDVCRAIGNYVSYSYK
jgi:hypothetical protein